MGWGEEDGCVRKFECKKTPLLLNFLQGCFGFELVWSFCVLLYELDCVA